MNQNGRDRATSDAPIELACCTEPQHDRSRSDRSKPVGSLNQGFGVLKRSTNPIRRK